MDQPERKSRKGKQMRMLVRATLGFMVIATLAGCGRDPEKKEDNVAQQTIDASVVNVFYFHGKQRCKTCVAVGGIAKETVGNSYADNAKVVFTELDTSEKSNAALVEKYGVTWNALIIAKGEDSVDITKQAFATALGNPRTLEDLIKGEIGKRIGN